MFFRLFHNYPSADRPFVQQVHQLTGLYPRNIALFKRAFRHKSAIREISEALQESNERLEYLGDAVLDTVIAAYLYEHFPNEGEGFLTKMRAKMVSRNYLNNMAIRLGVDQLVEANLEHGAEGTSVNGNALEALIGAIYLDRGFSAASRFVQHAIIGRHVDLKALLAREHDYKSRLIEWGQKQKRSIDFRVRDASEKGAE
ncbi:MAG: ribonuclease III domain-containing protein, partial [Bacteroidota bacterium]